MPFFGIIIRNKHPLYERRYIMRYIIMNTKFNRFVDKTNPDRPDEQKEKLNQAKEQARNEKIRYKEVIEKKLLEVAEKMKLLETLKDRLIKELDKLNDELNIN